MLGKFRRRYEGTSYFLYDPLVMSFIGIDVTATTDYIYTTMELNSKESSNNSLIIKSDDIGIDIKDYWVEYICENYDEMGAGDRYGLSWVRVNVEYVQWLNNRIRTHAEPDWLGDIPVQTG